MKFQCFNKAYNLILKSPEDDFETKLPYKIEDENIRDPITCKIVSHTSIYETLYRCRSCCKYFPKETAIKKKYTDRYGKKYFLYFCKNSHPF